LIEAPASFTVKPGFTLCAAFGPADAAVRRRAAGRLAALEGAARRRLLALVAFAAGFDFDFDINRFCARLGIVVNLSKRTSY